MPKHGTPSHLCNKDCPENRENLKKQYSTRYGVKSSLPERPKVKFSMNEKGQSASLSDLAKNPAKLSTAELEHLRQVWEGMDKSPNPKHPRWQFWK